VINGFDFIVRSWGASAPGLSSVDDWKNWYATKQLPPASKPVLPDSVPKMLQRRLSLLARLVFHAAGQCLDDGAIMPTVFSSAHGEIGKSLEMLKAIQAGEELSPTAFSLSVHNAIAGLFSIAYNNCLEMTVIAPGREGIAPAFIEALGLLHENGLHQNVLQENAGEVLLVFYDEPIADFYPLAPFNLNAAFPVALALRVGLSGDGLPMRLSRASESRDDGEHPVQLPAFLRFLLGDEQSLTLGDQGRGWRWDKR